MRPMTAVVNRPYPALTGPLTPPLAAFKRRVRRMPPI